MKFTQMIISLNLYKKCFSLDRAFMRSLEKDGIVILDNLVPESHYDTVFI